MKRPSSAELRRGMTAARAVVTAHVNGPPARIVRERGGLTNLVYRASHPEGDFVVRLSQDPDKLHVFRREQVAMRRARSAGVPSPVVLAIGDEVRPYVYMLSRHVRGIPATRHPDRERILNAMGRYAAIINSIPTAGFGSTFDWSSDVQDAHQGRTFRAFLRDELELDARLELLATKRMLPEATLRRVRSVLESSDLEGRSPAFVHGDLRAKNVLVDKSGEITAIIDWEDSTSCLAPEWEWSIALHDLAIDEKHAFLSGYGAGAASIATFMPVAKALNIVNYAPTVASCAGRADEAGLDGLRLRLHGALDLYSI